MPGLLRPVRQDLNVSGTVNLLLFGDLHVGSDEFLEDKFLTDLARLEDPNTFAVFNGDLFNADTKRERHGGIYRAAMPLDDAVDWLERHLTPYTGKILAFTSGNHDDRAFAQVGIDPVKQLAARLRLQDKYLREGGWLWTRHGTARGTADRHGEPRGIEYVGFVSHGTGNGPSSTSAERVMDRFPNCDYYGLGHTHSPLVTSRETFSVYPQTGSIVRRRHVLAVGGSYLAYGGYALEKRMQPRPQGVACFRLSDGEKWVEAVIP